MQLRAIFCNVIIQITRIASGVNMRIIILKKNLICSHTKLLMIMWKFLHNFKELLSSKEKQICKINTLYTGASCLVSKERDLSEIIIFL